MRHKILALPLLCAALIVQCADDKGPVSFVNGTLEKGQRTLVFHFTDGDKPIDKRVVMQEDVVDVKRCNFISKTYGVAFFIQTRSGDKSSFYYGTMFIDTDEKQIAVRKIKAPEGDWQLVGIINTHGDSVVATAMQHLRGQPDGDKIKGWTLIDNCADPRVNTPDTPDIGYVVQFETPAGRNYDKIELKPEKR